MAKNRTRRNKTAGGNRRDRRNKTEGGARRNKTEGGKRRRSTRKVSKGADAWREGVMRVYKDMKKANPNVKLGDAMKKAAELKRKGQL
jgi:hypothetical protein